METGSWKVPPLIHPHLQQTPSHNSSLSSLLPVQPPTPPPTMPTSYHEAQDMWGHPSHEVSSHDLIPNIRHPSISQHAGTGMRPVGLGPQGGVCLSLPPALYKWGCSRKALMKLSLFSSVPMNRTDACKVGPARVCPLDCCQVAFYRSKFRGCLA